MTATATSSQPGYPPELAVDGNASTFWVSGGTAEGQGPQPSRPEILTLEYTSVQTVREVRVTPRTTAIGPRAFAIEARVDGAWRRLGDFTQGNTAQTFVVPLTRADAIRLVITAAYDQGRPPERARNVQISEVALVSSDKLAPVSSATAPAAGTVGTAIAVDWTASDAEPSWGLERVELYVKGPHDTTFAKSDTDSMPGTSGRFMFVPARGVGRYELYTVAVDQAGHAEDAPSTADAMIDVGPRTVTQEGGVGGVVPPTLALALGAPVGLRRIHARRRTDLRGVHDGDRDLDGRRRAPQRRRPEPGRHRPPGQRHVRAPAGADGPGRVRRCVRAGHRLAPRCWTTAAPCPTTP